MAQIRAKEAAERRAGDPEDTQLQVSRAHSANWYVLTSQQNECDIVSVTERH